MGNLLVGVLCPDFLQQDSSARVEVLLGRFRRVQGVTSGRERAGAGGKAFAVAGAVYNVYVVPAWVSHDDFSVRRMQRKHSSAALTVGKAPRSCPSLTSHQEPEAEEA